MPTHSAITTEHLGVICTALKCMYIFRIQFVCVEVLWLSQPNGVMSSAVNLPNHMFTGQA